MISNVSKKNIKHEKLIIDDSKTNVKEYYEVAKNPKSSEAFELKHTESDIIDLVSHKLDDSLDKQTLFEKEPSTASIKVKDIVHASARSFLLAKDELDTFDNSYLSFNFYTDNISRFNKTYSNYLSNIDEEQKIIFKISEKLLDNFKGISPKLILINYGGLLSGIAVVYYDYSNESNIRLVLSHFSTIHFKFYHNILVELIEFLKANFVFHEIFVELY